MARAMMSDEPPGGYGTTMRIGLDGQVCAATGKAAASRVMRVSRLRFKQVSGSKLIRNGAVAHC